MKITITNLTFGNHFTPILTSAHDNNTHLFQAGEKATSSLQELAEGGAYSSLVTDVASVGGLSRISGLTTLGLAPNSKTEKFSLDTGDLTHLSIVSMVLPTNDAFIGLDAWKIPSEAGSYTLNLNAYDAGTEANNELLTPDSGMAGVLGIPAAPGKDGGTGGSGLSDDATNNNVHIHPGVIGDTDKSGGLSDLDTRIHRWLNPVARVVVTVK